MKTVVRMGKIEIVADNWILVTTLAVLNSDQGGDQVVYLGSYRKDSETKFESYFFIHF